MEDNKKVAAMLVMGLKKKPKDDAMSSSGASEMPDDEGTEESDSMTAGKEVMDSLKSGDVKGFVESLKSFIKLCDYPEEQSEESSKEM